MFFLTGEGPMVFPCNIAALFVSLLFLFQSYFLLSVSFDLLHALSIILFCFVRYVMVVPS